MTGIVIYHAAVGTANILIKTIYDTVYVLWSVLHPKYHILLCSASVVFDPLPFASQVLSFSLRSIEQRFSVRLVRHYRRKISVLRISVNDFIVLHEGLIDFHRMILDTSLT